MFGSCRLQIWTLDIFREEVKKVLWIVYLVIDLIICKMLVNSDLSLTARIGKTTRFVHNANGVIIGSVGTTIGGNCEIYHQVTIGVKNGNKNGPHIGNHTFIGAGAKILGEITIGDNALIGANAVVLHDIPPGCIAVGGPARIIVPMNRK